MVEDNTEERYTAFVSYSQKDSAEAGKIQSWLESFRLPKANAAPGKNGRKLGRIFRDKTDLTASPEVWPALQAKIAASEYLIVLCSPNAAQSEWVDKEIRHFRATGRADKVLALIIAGPPNSGDEATECFPPAFREAEPLAANLVLDGRTSALTRIAAGLAGVPFDALWQRQRRRQRRQMAVGGSLVALGLMLTAAAIVAGWFALEFQEDARVQSALADERFALAERRNSDILAREAKAIFADENGDHTNSILMALQADPLARRNALRHHFDGQTGYAFARARMEAGVANNRLRHMFTGHQGAVLSVALTG
ncbi:MAG: toll/interleukin-1 receptor domain-containing protein, partial [Pseudomonadota bacterium]